MTHSRFRAIVILLLLGAAAAPAAGQYEPRLRFRVLATPHFRIYFHQGEEAIASRLAAIAEDTRPKLSARLGLPAPALTHVILVDQTDVSNGWATPVPYDTIQITAIPPEPRSPLGNADDWLRLVFTHEYTHILHLDETGGVMAAVRAVFGRTPPAFPNLFLPLWETEGIAVYAESTLTGRGRLRAGDFAAIMTQEARAGRFQPIDRAGGGLVAWPSGNAPYLYGGFFTQFLADRYGASTLGDLARHSARRLPLFGGGAFNKTYGKGATQLWAEFERKRVAESAGTKSIVTTVRRLTTHGFAVSGPRFVRDRGTGGPASIWYSVQTPDGFPGLYRVGLDGRPPVRLADRYQGEGISASKDWVYFDQLEISGATSLFGDLYARRLSTGRTWRLTRGSRFASPDVSPDGSRLAVVVADAGRRSIAILRLREPVGPGRPPSVDLHPELSVAAPDTQFLSPRWSPDGSNLVAERQRLDGTSDIVLIDGRLGTVSTLVTSRRSRNVAPSWSPDGRFVVFGSARGQEPFELLRIAIENGTRAGAAPVSRVLSIAGGAMSPEVAPDGRTVVFVGLTDQGYDLFSAPLPSANLCEDVTFDSDETPPVEPASATTPPSRPPDAAKVRTYSPWATLGPRAWEPRLVSDGDRWLAGAAVTGQDVLGYHAYAIDLLWPVSPVANLGPGLTRRRPDWSVNYAYYRWWPAFFAGMSSTTTPYFNQTLAPGRAPEDIEEQSREVAAGVLLVTRRTRYAHSVFATVDFIRDTLRTATLTDVSTRNAVRLGFTLTTARFYGYPVSPEHGLTTRLTYEAVVPALGADGAARAGTFDARVYLPTAIPHAVVAVRAAVGLSSGDPRVSRVFSLGGNQAQSGYDFGRHALGLLRGFAQDTATGDRIGVVNLDVRVRLARLERGSGAMPIFLNQLHAAAFVDAGDAWSGRAPGWREIRTSAGAEMAFDVTLGYSYPFTLATGVALTRDPAARTRKIGPAIFVRVGRAF